ncbi:efflux RND transporter periplasmic adaptor subunit [Bdellovibrionota bacterium FG-1]
MKWKWKWIVIGVILAVAIGAAFFFKKKSASSVSYTPVKAVLGNISMNIISTGVVQPENRVEIKPPIPGRAEQVLVDEGYSIKRGQILVWMSSTERAALLDAARARGPSEVARWEDLYKPTPILAPITGTIISRNIEHGQTFATTDAILVMSDRLTIQAQVDETDIAQIHLKQGAEIVLDAYPNVSTHAVVEKIAYDAKTVNNVTTYIVTVIPGSVPKFMRSGMTANVTFQLAAKTGVLVVPADAIRTQDSRPYVLMAPGKGKKEPEKREIQLGLSDGRQVEILSGLSEGEIVLAAQFKPGGSKTGGASPFSPMGTRRGH